MDCECCAAENYLMSEYNEIPVRHDPEPLDMSPEQLDEELNDSADILMATYGWNDLALHGDMRRVIKNHLRMINETYIRKLKEKKESLMDEIRDRIQHSSISVGGDVPINEYQNGGCYFVTGVTVSDSFGNKFQFDSNAASVEYHQQTGYTSKWCSLPSNLKYIPSYMWPQEDYMNSEQMEHEKEVKAQETSVKKETYEKGSLEY